MDWHGSRPVLARLITHRQTAAHALSSTHLDLLDQLLHVLLGLLHDVVDDLHGALQGARAEGMRRRGGGLASSGVAPRRARNVRFLKRPTEPPHAAALHLVGNEVANADGEAVLQEPLVDSELDLQGRCGRENGAWQGWWGPPDTRTALVGCSHDPCTGQQLRSRHGRLPLVVRSLCSPTTLTAGRGHAPATAPRAPPLGRAPSR